MQLLQGDNRIRKVYCWLLIIHCYNFIETWHKAFLGKGNINLPRWRETHVYKGRWLQHNKCNDNCVIKHILLLFYWVNLAQSFLGYSLWQVCWVGWSRPFPKEDIAKLHFTGQILKSSISYPWGQFEPNLVQASLVNGNSSLFI